MRVDHKLVCAFYADSQYSIPINEENTSNACKMERMDCCGDKRSSYVHFAGEERMDSRVDPHILGFHSGFNTSSGTCEKYRKKVKFVLDKSHIWMVLYPSTL